MDLWQDPADQYLDFARQAADSACFSAWSAAVAADQAVLEWLSTLPRLKQQPNLVFAAARWHGVEAPGPYDGLRAALLGDDGTIRSTIMDRFTQTNEVGRLATLVPAFALVSHRADGTPLSLLEVGASAGLCLYPDRWTYRWTGPVADVTAGEGPELTCRVEGPAPLPSTIPRVARRAGIDLTPIDVTNTESTAWLENLVWPEQDDRRARLRAAIGIAQTDPPHLIAGDLLERLPDLVDEAGRHGPVVVFHSAVIAYLDDSERHRFDQLIRSLVSDGACHWISNESKNVLPSVTSTGPAPGPEHQTFVLGLDGQALAWTHGHGRSMRWLQSHDSQENLET